MHYPCEIISVRLSFSPLLSIYAFIHHLSVSQTNSEETNVDLPTPSTKRSVNSAMTVLDNA